MNARTSPRPHKFEVRLSPIAFGNQTISSKCERDFVSARIEEIHGFASPPRGEFAFIVCNRRSVKDRGYPLNTAVSRSTQYKTRATSVNRIWNLQAQDLARHQAARCQLQATWERPDRRRPTPPNHSKRMAHINLAGVVTAKRHGVSNFTREATDRTHNRCHARSGRRRDGGEKLASSLPPRAKAVRVT